MAKAEPDIATMTVVIRAEGSFAQDAVNADRMKVKRAVNALHDMGIEDADISRSTPQLTARFAPPTPSPVATQPANAAIGQGGGSGNSVPAQVVPQPPRAPVPNGFWASSTLRIKMRNLSDLGLATDRVSDAADKSVPTITFSVSDPQKLVDEARLKAFDDAERGARLEAERAHLKLGSVRSIRDEPAMSRLADVVDRLPQMGSNANNGALVLTTNGSRQTFMVNVEVQWNVGP
jgi:uncharacterized protein YggE